MTTRWLVRPTPSTRLDGDEDQILDLPAASNPPATAVIGDVRRQPDGRILAEAVVNGWRFELELEDADRAELRARATRGRPAADGPVAGTPGGAADIRAMIPGRVAEVRVTEGDAVVAGQTLLVVEAMKMQNEIRAPKDGVVAAIHVQVGSSVRAGETMAVVE